MSTVRLPKQAALSGLLLALCTLAAWPFAEIGGNDDFSYVRSAKVLAETGHIAYFGWSSAMLGCQLYLGALFFRLFGFSFTASRASILLVAVLTAWFLQRSFVLLGLRESNATFATLTLVLSPLFVPLSFSFMSDIPGLLAIVLALYCCLRALETQIPRHTFPWLLAAALSSTVLGTARQTGWLGVIVIVPCACWLLRRRKLPFVLIGCIWVLCGLLIVASLHWFSSQLYTTAEDSATAVVHHNQLFDAAMAMLRIPLLCAFFLFPIFTAFAVECRRRGKAILLIPILLCLIPAAYYLHRPDSYWMNMLFFPACTRIGDYVTASGILDLPAIGQRPLMLTPVARIVISVLCYSAAIAFLVLSVFFRRKREAPPAAAADSSFSWERSFILLGPFTLAYCAFLSLRIPSGTVFDRYLLPLFVVFAFAAMALYQEHFSARIPNASYVVLFCFAAFSIASTHDMFAEGRARLAAVHQLLAAGLPRTSFYGGFAYDGWTQIDAQGHIEVGDIRTPTGIHHLSRAQRKFDPCGYEIAYIFPAIKPRYVLSWDNIACEPQPSEQFAPVWYRTWLPPFSGAIYTRSISSTDLRQPVSADSSARP